ncbi:MAG: hypothetical protein K2M93_04310 [Muribaculaceae bacterium]|nr:hypothetical protein [Muribaculaceae bacterium]
MKILLVLVFAALSTFGAKAKDYDVSLVTEPSGATVYLNGNIVAQTTPAIIKVDSKMAKRNLIFLFEKKDYEGKTVIVNFDKKELKNSPVVFAKLSLDQVAIQKQKEAEQNRETYKNDPTIPNGQANSRVSRDRPGETKMEETIIRWYFDSDPRGACISYRVISNNPSEVKNTNETYLTTTPYEETRSFNIPGLTYANSRNVTVEIKISKKGYLDQVKRYNVRQAFDQQEISGFFELVPKDE